MYDQFITVAKGFRVCEFLTAETKKDYIIGVLRTFNYNVEDTLNCLVNFVEDMCDSELAGMLGI